MILNRIITITNGKVVSFLLALVLVIGGSSVSSSTEQEISREQEAIVASQPSSLNSSAIYEIAAVSQKIDVSLKEKDLPRVPQLTDTRGQTTQNVDENSPNGFIYSEEIPMSRELQVFTYETSVEKGIDYTVVLAIIWKESKFNPNAVGYNSNGTSDNGLMQINDVNRGWLKNQHGITNLMDPEESIVAGTTILGTLAEEHGEQYAIMAYKSGEGGMLRNKSAGVTTNSYTENVRAKSLEYKALLDSREVVDL